MANNTGFGVDAKIKDSFFDRGVVEKYLSKAATKGLFRGASRIRDVARASMKKKGYARDAGKLKARGLAKREREIKNRDASKPGSPPFSHTDDTTASLRNIWYAFDAATLGAVAGPLRLNSGSVPALHEFGGTRTITEVRNSATSAWRPAGKRIRPGQETRQRQATYAPRPFMGPALDKVAPKLPAFIAAAGG